MWPRVSDVAWVVVGPWISVARETVGPKGSISLSSACQDCPGLSLVSRRNIDPTYQLTDQGSRRSMKPFEAQNVKASQLGSRAQTSAAMGML